MAKICSPIPVKLFIGVLTSIPEIMTQVEQKLAAHFGTVDLRSEPFLFDWTHYYDETMGSPIHRCFLSFSDLIEPSTIAEIKIKTNDLESAFASEWTEVPRPINLDPGYLEQSKIVLASAKNFYHRILISRGIYAEVTLRYSAGAWHAFPWTFPDFASDRYGQYFLSLRKLYRSQLQNGDCLNRRDA
jgi:hypothetical protein